MTKEIIKIAVQNYGNALSFVPEKEKEKSEEIIRLAIQNNGYALRYVPEKYKIKLLNFMSKKL